MMEEPAAEGDEKQADQRASAAVSVQKSSDQAPVSVSKAQPSREPETSVMKSVDRVGTAASIASAPEQAEPVKVFEEPPFKPNDYLQKAEMEPPCDPQG